MNRGIDPSLLPSSPRPVTRRRHSPILDSSGRPMEAAYFDNADTTRMNSKHWQYAVGGDFNALLSGDLEILRRRARYEITNNSYGGGIADTLAYDIVGTGPYPQLDSGNEAFDQEAEEKFITWGQNCDYCGQMDLTEILQMQLALQQCEAGESLTLFKRDSRVRYGVSLRLMCVDIDRLCSYQLSDRILDGIEFDDDGRPVKYHILKHHPSGSLVSLLRDTEAVPASEVIHLYRIKRPGQRRGIPWFAAALGTFAQLRRFTQATLDAAESAANNHGTLEAEGEAVFDGTMDVLELERNGLLQLPPGYTMNQVKPEHPATTFQMFKGEIINEIGRGVLMPYNVAAMNSSRYNYASGRLDHQKFHRFIECIRHWGDRRLLKPVFSAYVTEGYLIDGYFRSRPTFEDVMRAIESLRWFWPGFKHVDPVKEATAEKIRLDSGTMTLEESFAEGGKDWKRQLEQRAKEAAYKKELQKKYNLTPAEMDGTPAPAVPAHEDNDDEEKDAKHTPDD